MPHGTGSTERDPSLAPKPNPITNTPPTPAACAGDLRTPAEQAVAAADAKVQRGTITPGGVVA